MAAIDLLRQVLSDPRVHDALRASLDSVDDCFPDDLGTVDMRVLLALVLLADRDFFIQIRQNTQDIQAIKQKLNMP